MRKVRFLVLRGGAIGDFIMTLPVLKALRSRWPEAYIEIIGYPHIAQLAHAGGLADKITSLDNADVARYFSMKPSFSDEQIEYIRLFDIIINYLYDPFSTLRDNLISAGAKQVIYGSPKVEDNSNEGLTSCGRRISHAVDHLFKPLATLAIYPEGLECPRLNLKKPNLENGLKRISGIGSRVIAIHPGSGSPTKNWLLDKFVGLAEMISGKTSSSPVFILGEADFEIEHELNGKGNRFPVISGCSLVELAEAISACCGYIGNDSGITHIAASLGIPVVALYGPTDPGIWGPRGPAVRVIRSPESTTDGLGKIPAEQVFVELMKLTGI